MEGNVQSLRGTPLTRFVAEGQLFFFRNCNSYSSMSMFILVHLAFRFIVQYGVGIDHGVCYITARFGLQYFTT